MKEIVLYFFRLGCLGFGGPLAAIATMQRDLVEERRWISEDDFAKALAFIKAMPGPVSYQMAIFLGTVRGGRMAGFLAGLLFVLPAFLLMMVLAHCEALLHDSPWLPRLLAGFQASALGVVIFSLKTLFWPYRRNALFWIVAGIGAFVYVYLDPQEIVLILGGGAVALLYRKCTARHSHELGSLFIVCFTAGALVFGTGLAIVPLLEADFVSTYHWVTYSQFMNGVSFGQLTPGPVMITASYLGYLSHGFLGAVVATIGVFLASTFHMLTWFPYALKRLSAKAWLQDFATGAIACVLVALCFFCWKQGVALPWKLHGVVLLTLLSLTFFRIPAWLLLPGMGIVGMFLA